MTRKATGPSSPASLRTLNDPISISKGSNITMTISVEGGSPAQFLDFVDNMAADEKARPAPEGRALRAKKDTMFSTGVKSAVGLLKPRRAETKAIGAEILENDPDLRGEGAGIMDRTVGNGDLRHGHANTLASEIAGVYSGRIMQHYQRDEVAQGDIVAVKTAATLFPRHIQNPLGPALADARQEAIGRVEARRIEQRDQERARVLVTVGEQLGQVGEQLGEARPRLPDELLVKINSYLPHPGKEDNRC